MCLKVMNWVQMAKAAGISVTAVDRLRYEGKLSYSQVGGRVLFTEKHLQELLDRHERLALKPRPRIVASK